MKGFYERAISAIIFAIIFISGLIFDPYVFSVMMLVLLLLCHHEYYNHAENLFSMNKGNIRLYKYSSLVFFILSYTFIAISILNKYPMGFVFLIPIFMLFYFIIELFLKSEKPFQNIGINVIPFLWILYPICLTLILGLGNGQFSGAIVLGIVLMIWANDTGAYIVGTLIGKNKLLPHISPKKSIEGVIGGMVFTVLIGFIISSYLSKVPLLRSINSIAPSVWITIAIFVSIFGVIGDLVESMFKRSLGIKDSGNIMPGHGGALDRFDAYLFVMPFVFTIIKIFN